MSLGKVGLRDLNFTEELEATNNGGPIRGQIERALDAAAEDLRELARGSIVFRPPALYQRWKELLDLAAARHNPYLHLVSFDDTKYWQTAKSRKPSDARFYEAAVRAFQGEKERILVFQDAALDTPEKRKKALEVVEWMKTAGIRVSALPTSEAQLDGIVPDFGLIGGLVVSRFEGGGNSTVRELRETFEPQVLATYRGYWHQLKASPLLWDESREPFSEWVHNTFPSLAPEEESEFSN